MNRWRESRDAANLVVQGEGAVTCEQMDGEGRELLRGRCQVKARVRRIRHAVLQARHSVSPAVHELAVAVNAQRTPRGVGAVPRGKHRVHSPRNLVRELLGSCLREASRDHQPDRRHQSVHLHDQCSLRRANNLAREYRAHGRSADLRTARDRAIAHE